MALSGNYIIKCTTSGVTDKYMKFAWTATQNINNNTSTISWKLLGGDPDGGWVKAGGFKVVIDGTTVYSQSTDYRIKMYTDTLIASGTKTITHNTNGSRTFTVYCEAGIYNYAINSTGSYTFTLNTIPRASSITSTSNVTLGNKCSIKWTPLSTAFKYKIKFALGGWNYTTGYISPATTSAYTYTEYTIPNTEALLDDIPNSTTGTMTATLYTYNSSGAQIGSASSKTFIVTVPSSIVPTIGTITLTPQTYNYLIQGKNKINIAVSGCSAGTGSSIKSYTFSGPGISSTTTSTSVTSSSTVSTTGTLTYTVKVTDNRGRTASKTKTITCYEYSAPKITSFNAYRVGSSTSTTADDSGTYMRCDYKLAFSPVNSSNDVTVKILYKKNTASSYSSSTVLTDGTSTYGNKTLSGIDTASTYTVYATITDNYGGSSSSTVKTVFGASRILNITSNGTGVAFGKMAESDELLESRYLIKAPGLRSARDGRKNSTLDIEADDEHINSLEYYIAKDTTSGGPGVDGHVIHCHWDNDLGYDSQLFLHDATGQIMSRGCDGGVWGSWRTSLDDVNYTSYVAPKPVKLDTLTTCSGGTITLLDDVSNYTYLEIYYHDNTTSGKIGNQSQSVKVYYPDGNGVDLSCAEAGPTNGRSYLRSTRYDIAGNAITFVRSKIVTFVDGADYTVTQATSATDNYVRITRVLGYK